MTCGDITAIIISSLTLLVTVGALCFSICSYRKTIKKEFENMIFSKLESISFYVYDIANCKDASKTKYPQTKDIKEAEKDILIGFSYLYEYGRSHKMKYLKAFSDCNPTDEFSKNYSLAKPFFSLNGAFQDFRDSIEDKNKNSQTNDKLDLYCNAFREYLHLSIKYALSYLYIRTKNNKAKKENEQDESLKIKSLLKFKNDLTKIETYCKENQLI